MVFFGFVFWGFDIKKVCFWCVWHCFKSVKNTCFIFPVFWGFCGVASSCLFGFGRFRCFCVSWVCLSFLCCFCFCFVCFVFVFLCVFFLVFWGSGEVARRATSLGPKPSLFVYLFFLFSLFFLFLFFLEGLRVRWGGPKRHLTWP